MAPNTHAWEMPLLALAQDAWHSLTHTPQTHGPTAFGQHAQQNLVSASPTSLVKHDSGLLASAYAGCEAITKTHSRSFHLASSLLPSDKRRAVRALYAFCRVTDDLVDRPGADPREALEVWRQVSLSAAPPADSPVALAWADTRQRYRIPRRYAEQLLDGVERDLSQTRYVTFEDLATYCYGVASTVGLMSMHIIGFSGPEAIPYAIKLGVALQLTNILRDIATDFENGRIYLPLDELDAFGITRRDLVRGTVTDHWRRFMAFQIDRNRQLYDEARPGIALLAADGRFAIAAAADLYRGILDDIEAHDYDVFSRRAHVSAAGKLARLPGIWLSTRRLGRLTAAS